MLLSLKYKMRSRSRGLLVGISCASDIFPHLFHIISHAPIIRSCSFSQPKISLYRLFVCLCFFSVCLFACFVSDSTSCCHHNSFRLLPSCGNNPHMHKHCQAWVSIVWNPVRSLDSRDRTSTMIFGTVRHYQ